MVRAMKAAPLAPLAGRPWLRRFCGELIREMRCQRLEENMNGPEVAQVLWGMAR